MVVKGAWALRSSSGRALTCWVGIMMPIFSMAFANSSGSTVPLLLRSKYLKAFMRIASSLCTPLDFCASLFLSSLSKLGVSLGPLT